MTDLGLFRPAACVKVGGKWKIVYICRDHLGSITYGLDRYTYAPNNHAI